MSVSIHRDVDHPKHLKLIAPDTNGKLVMLMLPDEEWLRLMMDNIDPNLVVHFCARLLHTKGYRVQKKRIGVFSDTWETI